jgi:hypothetical protein
MRRRCVERLARAKTPTRFGVFSHWQRSDGSSRIAAAAIGGVTLQIIRDWVVKFNAAGTEG